MSKKTDLTKIDWVQIQEKHNNGIYWNNLPKIVKISLRVLNRAESEGYIKKIPYQKHPTDEQIKVMSDRTKKYLKDNPDKHPWKKHEKFKSIPCEKFKDMLRKNGISFLPEYPPLENRHYAVDVAFPDKKIAIEINGNQHYSTADVLKPYYQEKHDNITNAGWKVLEIRSRLVFNKEYIDKIILSLKKDYNLGEFDYLNSPYLNFKKTQKNKRKYGTKEEYINSKKQEYDELQKQKINLLLNSNIEFSKYGWGKKASETLMILPQKVKKWMERYVPDFYKEKCFKKNNLNKYCSCGKKIKEKSKKCTTCKNLALRKIPSVDQLKKDLEIMNKTQVAKKYKVRRTSLYKFMKRNNIL